MAIVSVDLDLGQELLIKQQSKLKVTAPFLGIGVPSNNFNKVKGMNVAALMKNMSPAGTWFFWELFEKINSKTNCSVHSTSDADSAEIKRVTRGYKELSSLGLVLRVEKATYMVNPSAVVPEFGRYLELKNKWDSLQKS
jgi:hypothetical protein